MSVPGFAANDQEKYTYTESNGSIIEYYKDADGHPYKYEQGKKNYMLLNLEENIITEEELLSVYGFQTDDRLVNVNNLKTKNVQPFVMRAFGNEYTVLFEETINFVSSSYQTGTFPYPSRSNYVHVNINSTKPAYANNNVNLLLVWRSKDDGKLHSELYQNQNIAIDKSYYASSSVVSEIRLGLVALGAMTSCKLIIRSATIY